MNTKDKIEKYSALVNLDGESLDHHKNVLKESHTQGIRLIEELKTMVKGPEGLIPAFQKEKSILEDQILTTAEERQENQEMIKKVEKLLFILEKVGFESSTDDFQAEYNKYIQLNTSRYIRFKGRILEFTKPKENPEYSIYLGELVDKINQVILLLEKIQHSLPLKLYFESKLIEDQKELEAVKRSS